MQFTLNRFLKGAVKKAVENGSAKSLRLVCKISLFLCAERDLSAILLSFVNFCRA